MAPPNHFNCNLCSSFGHAISWPPTPLHTCRPHVGTTVHKSCSTWPMGGRQPFELPSCKPLQEGLVIGHWHWMWKIDRNTHSLEVESPLVVEESGFQGTICHFHASQCLYKGSMRLGRCFMELIVGSVMPPGSCTASEQPPAKHQARTLRRSARFDWRNPTEWESSELDRSNTCESLEKCVKQTCIARRLICCFVCLNSSTWTPGETQGVPSIKRYNSNQSRKLINDQYTCMRSHSMEPETKCASACRNMQNMASTFWRSYQRGKHLQWKVS